MLYRWNYIATDCVELLSVYVLEEKGALALYDKIKDDADLFKLINNRERCIVIENNKITIALKEKFEEENYLNILPF